MATQLGRYTVFDNFPVKLLQEPIVSVQHNIQKKPGLVNVTVEIENEQLHISLWKPLAQTLKDNKTLDTEPLRTITKEHPLVAVLVCHGGQFSGCIFKCDPFKKPLQQRSKLDKHQIAIPVLRKTFHKYTTRKKQGKRQVTHDGITGNAAQSIGSQIRREQEKLFQLQLTTLLQETWKETLEKCVLICLYCPGQFNYNSVMELLPPSSRERVANIPFTISKPNYSHVILAFKKLMTVHIRDRINANDDEEDLESDDESSSEEDTISDEEEAQPTRKRTNSYQKKNTNRDWTSEPLTPLSAMTYSATPSSADSVSEDVFNLPEPPPKPVVKKKKLVKVKKHPIVEFYDRVTSYRLTITCVIAVMFLILIVLSEDYTKERREAGFDE
jgi:hypothetical protein